MLPSERRLKHVEHKQDDEDDEKYRPDTDIHVHLLVAAQMISGRGGRKTSAATSRSLGQHLPVTRDVLLHAFRPHHEDRVIV